MKFFRYLFRNKSRKDPRNERLDELIKMFGRNLVLDLLKEDNNCGIFIDNIKINPHNYDHTNKELVDTVHNMKDLSISEYKIWFSHMDNKVKLLLKLKTINKEYNRRWVTPDDINKEDNE